MIPLARPVVGDAELGAARRVLGSGRLVLGPEAVAFEARLAELAGARHGVAVSSGTAALHLALWALDVGPGDEVLVPALTFPAPAAAVVALGAKPVLVDVDGASWNISPEGARRALSTRTKAILAVDQFGAPAEWGALEEIASEAGVVLVEDAACSLGARLDGRPCGSFGRLAALSFHPRKVITTGEGGAVLTDDEELAARVRSLRDHGRRDGRFAEVGLNLRLGELPAAIGLAQLERLDGLVARRRELAARYLAALGPDGPAAGGLGLSFQVAPPGAEPAFQTFAALLPEESPLDRATSIAELARRGVEAGVASYSLGRLGPFAEAAGLERPEDLPVADALHHRGLALPLCPTMEDRDVDEVVGALVGCLGKGGP